MTLVKQALYSKRLGIVDTSPKGISCRTTKHNSLGGSSQALSALAALL